MHKEGKNGTFRRTQKMLCEQSKIQSAMETDDVIYENTTETSKPNHVKKKQLKYKKQNKIIIKK